MTRATRSVVLDSNVLWSSYLRDLVLELAYRQRYVPYWCDRILSSLSRHLEPQLVQKQLDMWTAQGSPHAWDELQAQAHTLIHEKISGKLIPTIQKAFPHAMVKDADYEELLDFCHNAHEDRHVLATAMASGAHFILTYNLKDFPTHILELEGIQACTPDTFLAQEIQPEHIYEALTSVVTRYNNPSISVMELIQRLEHKHGMHASMHGVRQYMTTRNS